MTLTIKYLIGTILEEEDLQFTLNSNIIAKGCSNFFKTGYGSGYKVDSNGISVIIRRENKFTAILDLSPLYYFKGVIQQGLIAVALFAALAKYSLLFSNSYMQEALKNADRRHAINFGKFYLASYGAMADWAQIKEAFENWNIRGENAFSKSENSKLDVTALDKFANTIEKIYKLIPTSNNDKST